MQHKSETRVPAAVEHTIGKAKAEIELTVRAAKMEMESALEKTKAEIVLSQCHLEGKIMQSLKPNKLRRDESGGMNDVSLFGCFGLGSFGVLPIQSLTQCSCRSRHRDKPQVINPQR